MGRQDSIKELKEMLEDQRIMDVCTFVPEGLTLSELAAQNHAKLVQRKAETGVFAKGV